MDKQELIFGAIGYTILYNSYLFSDYEILLIYDSHDEQVKQCNTNKENDIQINNYLELLLEKNYVIMIEEVPINPDKKTLVGLWNDSVHVKNIRYFFEKNNNNINLIPFDIRFELIDSFDETDYNTQTLKKYVHNMYKFFIFKHPFFKDLLLYSKSIDVSFIKNYYITLLIKFHKLIMTHKEDLNKQIQHINNNKELIDNINNLLSDIMEFYVILRLYNDMQNNKKIVIYGGLIHINNIKKILIKYYKFQIKEEYGNTDYNLHIGSIKNHINENQCIIKPYF